MLERLIHAQNRLIQALQAEVGRLQTRGGVSLFGKSDKESIVVDIFAVLSQTGIKPSSDAFIFEKAHANTALLFDFC